MKFDLGMYDAQTEKELLILSDFMPQCFAPGQTYSAALDHFAQSSWGVHQADQPPRYAGNFAYDAENNYHQMREDLGDAVHPINHNVVAQHDYQGYLLLDQLMPGGHDFSPFEIVGTRLAVTMHDTGETTHPDLVALCGGVVGDVPSGEKTPAHRAIERAILTKVFEHFLPRLDDGLKGYALDTIVHDPAVKHEPPHRLLEASHDSGEYQTGLWAGRLAVQLTRSGDDGLRTRQLARIATVVLPKVQKRLDCFTAEFPFFEQMLEKQSAEHDQILAELSGARAA